jgi:c-di-GMP-binding flagellar brake protein YcgR
MRPSTNESNGSMGTFPERRAAVRVLVQLDATVDDGKMARMYQTQNLSNSGMLLRTHKPIPVGTKVDVQFLFPGDPTLSGGALPGGYGFVEGEAVVVRHTHPVKEAITGMALRFTELESRGRDHLAQFLGGFRDGGPLGPTPA